MSKKKKRSVPVAPPKQEKKMVIDMNRMNRKKEYTVPSFRTGKHMTAKDRPRKKDWKREYEKGREPNRYRRNDIGFGSLAFLFTYICLHNRRRLNEKCINEKDCIFALMNEICL